MEMVPSSKAFKKLIKVAYSCNTLEQLEVAKRYLELYSKMYHSNSRMSTKVRITAQERMNTVQFILRMKYRSLVA